MSPAMFCSRAEPRPIWPAALHAVNLGALPVTGTPYAGPISSVHNGAAIYASTDPDYAHLPIAARPDLTGTARPIGRGVVVTGPLHSLDVARIVIPGNTPTPLPMHIDGRYYDVSRSVEFVDYTWLASGDQSPDAENYVDDEASSRGYNVYLSDLRKYRRSHVATPSFLSQQRFGELGQQLFALQRTSATARGALPGVTRELNGTLTVNPDYLAYALKTAGATFDGAAFLVNAAHRGRLIALQWEGPYDEIANFTGQTLGFLLPWSFFEETPPEYTASEIANFLQDVVRIGLVDRDLEITIDPNGNVVVSNFMGLPMTPNLILDPSSILDLEDAITKVRAHKESLKEKFPERHL